MTSQFSQRATAAPPRLWTLWLTVVSCGVMFAGLGMVFAPDLTRRGFSLLLYADAHHLDTWGVEAGSYISFVHAVLGAVLFGWGAALLCVVRGAFMRGERGGWNAIAVSAMAWFIPDTVYSLWSWVWQNALLNLVIALLLAISLLATYRTFHAPRR